MKEQSSTSHLDTRTMLLNAAQSFIQRQSYDGFSFRDLAEVVGIRKASIYYHFETKEALAVAMLERAKEGLAAWSLMHSTMPPQQRLNAYCFSLYRDLLGAGAQMCPAGVFSSSWSEQTEAIKAAAHSAMEQQRRFLRETFRDGFKDGSLKNPADLSIEDAADWFATSVQGALVTSRLLDGPVMFEKMCRITLSIVGATE